MTLSRRDVFLINRFKAALFKGYGFAEFDAATETLSNEKKTELARAIIDDNDLTPLIVAYKAAFDAIATPVAEQQLADAKLSGVVPIEIINNIAE